LKKTLENEQQEKEKLKKTHAQHKDRMQNVRLAKKATDMLVTSLTENLTGVEDRLGGSDVGLMLKNLKNFSDN